MTAEVMTAELAVTCVTSAVTTPPARRGGQARRHDHRDGDEQHQDDR
jgi:hypothetical protein